MPQPHIHPSDVHEYIETQMAARHITRQQAPIRAKLAERHADAHTEQQALDAGWATVTREIERGDVLRRWTAYFASLLCVALGAGAFALTFAGVAVVAALV